MPFMNPLREDELVQLLEPLGLKAGDRTVDLGGGRADLSRLLVERFGCIATSVDASPAACEAARQRAPGVEVIVARAEDWLTRNPTQGHALVAAVGAVHAFGDGLAGFRNALASVHARHLLFADSVALGPDAARKFEVARVEEVEALFRGRVVSAVHLGPERVAAYEQAWCDALRAYLVAHPGDPREDWVRERLAWSEAPDMRRARAELGFRAWVLHG